MPRIPEDIIDQVRQATDIVAIISEHLPLKRAGQNYRCLCPFHQERTPSFNVNPQKQIWHCFGCGKGGNVFTFLTEYEKISFSEAVRTLARRAGIRIPELPGDKSEGYDLLYQANEFAARFFQDALRGKVGAVAREYLMKRGITQETMDLFRLGYAPNTWSDLLEAAEAKGLTPALLLEAGLVVPRDRGSGYYDRFRHRIMFPFFSLGGRVIGFGGRSLEEAPQAKYLNSPETAIYHKGRGFFGFAQTRMAIVDSGSAILVEGNFDLLRSFQAGYKNIVATAGTALTPDQAKLLSRYARIAIICYDADPPGHAAAERALEPLLEAGLDVRVARMPEGLDPDGLITQEGEAAFGQVIKQAMSFVEFRVWRARMTKDISLAAEKSQLVNSLIALASRVSDPIKRSLYHREIAEYTGVDESLVTDLARKRMGLRPMEPMKSPAFQPAEQWERDLLALVIRRPELASRLAEKPNLADGLAPELRNIVETMDRQYQETGKVDVQAILGQELSPEARGLLYTAIDLSHLAEDSLDAVEADERRFADYLLRLEKLSLRPKLKSLQAAIREAQRSGDIERERELLIKYNNMIKEVSR